LPKKVKFKHLPTNFSFSSASDIIQAYCWISNQFQEHNKSSRISHLFWDYSKNILFS